MLFDDGVFDQDMVEEFPRFYTLDAILEEIAKPISYQMDVAFGNIRSVPYLLDVNFYNPVTSYLLDAVLVLDGNDPRFQETIINAIIWSCGRTSAKLSTAISTMGMRLMLPYATTDDLNLYWSKILGAKRRYNEPDEDFRRRLITRLAISKCSGTKPECEEILNNILGMENAVDLQTYWPAEVRVTWNSFYSMKAAETNFNAIKEALDEMLAAGVSWSTAFPYIQYNLDVNLLGPHSQPYSVDANISRIKDCTYLLRTDLFDTGTDSYDLDACLETPHSFQERLDTLIRADRSKTALLDANVSENHPKSYQNDAVLVQDRTKTEEVDAILEASGIDYYHLDMPAEVAHRGFYMLSTELVAA
jgi:hypothetical protein